MIEFDHQIPLDLGGTDDPDNLKPIHDSCHRRKTKEDIRAIAKARRLRRGRKKSGRVIPSRPFPKGR